MSESIFHHYRHLIRGQDCRGIEYREFAEAARDYVSRVKTYCFLNNLDRSPAFCRQILPDAETMDILGINVGARTSILRMRGEPHESASCFDRSCRRCFDENDQRIERGE